MENVNPGLSLCWVIRSMIRQKMFDGYRKISFSCFLYVSCICCSSLCEEVYVEEKA